MGAEEKGHGHTSAFAKDVPHACIAKMSAQVTLSSEAFKPYPHR